MRILIIRFSSIGDVVLQTPVASWLKQQFPKCHISFLTAKEFSSILEGHPHIDNVHSMERFRGKGSIRKLFQFSRQLVKTGDFDLIIDLHSNTRSRLISWFNPQVKILRIDKRKFERNFFVLTKLKILKNTPSIHFRNIQDLAKVLGKKYDLDSFTNFMHALSLKLTATSLPQEVASQHNNQAPTIVISAVASFASKRWPISKFNLLIEKIFARDDLNKYKVIVLGGKEDEYLLPLKGFEKSHPARFEYLQGKTSLKETINIISRAKICVGNDTGLGHIAEAFGISSLVLFGPTHPDFGFGVHGPNSKNILANVPCSPCSTLGDKPCRFEGQPCMEKIEVSTVMDEIVKVCASDF